MANIIGTAASESLTGTALEDNIQGLGGDDNIQGLGGDDVLIGGTGADTLVGGIGNDTYEVTDLGDVVIEQLGEGSDTVSTSLASYTLAANVENLTFGGLGNFAGTGNALDNRIVGGAGNDTLNGAAGNDVLIGGGGADALVGGLGNDTYEVTDLGDVVTEQLGAGIDTVSTSLATYTLTANVENLTFGGGGNFTGTGNTLDNRIVGGAGSDTLNGAAGNDVLVGGVGADTLVGGLGNDAYVVTDLGDVVTEQLGEGSDAVLTSLATYTLGANVESLTFAGSGNFTGIGNALGNQIVGGAGNDVLIGGGGADTLAGGIGNDTYEVTDLGDVVIEQIGAGIDTVSTSLATYTLGANVENLTFGGSGNFTGTGNALANRIVGGAGNDTLNGVAGNDVLIGGVGIDTLVGGVGNDTYEVTEVGDVVTEQLGEGSDTVSTSLATYTLGANVENLTFGGSGNFTGTGNALDNRIVGGAGNDTLNGAAGNDVLIGRAGADTLVGGLGNDTYEVTDLGDVVTEQLGAGIDTVSTSLANYTLGANVENLTFGGSGNFTGTGNALANRIVGGAGNDVLIGGGGADSLVGGTGNDTYEVTELGDVVTEQLGAGSDTVSTTLANYTLAANVEILLFNGIGNFTGTGNALGNRIVGGAGNDTLNGGAGNDVLIGGLGADTLVGGAGNDTYEVTDLGDVVTEQLGAGIDTVSTSLASYTLGANVENLTFGGSVNFTGTGNALDNRIVGGAGNDTLNGGAGNDVLIGGVGADALVGGIGNDIFEVTDLGDVVAEQLGEGTDRVSTSLASYTLAANVENLTFGGSGNFTGTGNALDNRIVGGAGNDTLNGAAGNDVLIGRAGADTLVGGLGNDTYEVTDLGDVVTEQLGAGIDTVSTSLASYTLGVNIENLTFGGIGNFTGIGNALGNRIVGGAGNDVLIGGGGADTLVGGMGNDTYEVTDLGDVVTEQLGAGVDTVSTSLASYTLSANVENLTFGGSGNFTGTGNALANRIVGGAGNDTLNGAAGNDVLIGGIGADALAGGTGNDTYEVTDLGDVVTEQLGAGTDTVSTSLASYTLGANVENLSFGGVGNFTGTGNALDNRIVGGAGNDTLNGGAGNDTVTGGAGNDLMNGGLGNDSFVFALAGFGNDTIQGFDADPAAGQDLLNIAGLGITSATFAANVAIAADGVDTVIGIGVDTIRLVGVSSAAIDQTDFSVA